METGIAVLWSLWLALSMMPGWAHDSAATTGRITGA